MLQGIAKWASKHADFIHFIIFHSVYQNDVSINNNSIQTTIILTDNFHDSIAGTCQRFSFCILNVLFCFKIHKKKLPKKISQTQR